MRVDHKNRNGLDNRRANLRIATPSQNNANSKIPINNTSGFKGVAFRKKKWEAYIMVNQKKIHLGRFLAKELAAAARSKAGQDYFGEFAR